MMNGPLTTDLGDPANNPTLAGIVDAPFLDTAGKVETLFLAALGRLPRKEESRTIDRVRRRAPRATRPRVRRPVLGARQQHRVQHQPLNFERTHVPCPAPLISSRRDWLRLTAVGAAGVSLSGWLRAPRRRRGGQPDPAEVRHPAVAERRPATIDLWDLKPGHANGGPFKEIDTAATGREDQRAPAEAREAGQRRWPSSARWPPRRATTAGPVILRLHRVRAAGGDPVPGGRARWWPRSSATATADLPGLRQHRAGAGAGTLGGGFLGPRFVAARRGRRATADPGTAPTS